MQNIRTSRISDTGAHAWATQGLRLTPSLLFQDMLRDLILVLAAFGLSDANAGILAVCLAIILVPNLALIAIEMGFGPQIAAAGSAGDTQRQRMLLRQSAKLRVLSVVPVIAAIQLFCTVCLDVFGPEYIKGETALRLLCLIPLLKVVFGNPTLLLNISGKSKEILRITGMGLVLMSISLPVASASFGMIGATLASALGYGFVMYRLYACCARSGLADASVLILFRDSTEERASA